MFTCGASVMWDTVSRERNEGQQPKPGCCLLLLFGLKEAESVGALSVLPHLEVEVVSGRVPGGAYIANHLALLDLLACHHTDGGTVGIQGFVSVVMAHFDVVPVPAAPGVYPIGDGDGAIRSSKDGGAARSADVGAIVVVDLPSKGIRPVAEPRGNGVTLRKRPLEDARSFPVGIGIYDLPAAADVTAQQFGPQVLIFRLCH